MGVFLWACCSSGGDYQMTLVLNEKAKRERSVKMDLKKYLATKCNTADYVFLLEQLYKADEDDDCYVNWKASNLDEAIVWMDTPQGDDFWRKWHNKLHHGVEE